MRGRRGAKLALLAVLAASLLAATGCGDLSRGELNRGVESLSALAAQGQLIANGVARDATKSTYARAPARRRPSGRPGDRRPLRAARRLPR